METPHPLHTVALLLIPLPQLEHTYPTRILRAKANKAQPTIIPKSAGNEAYAATTHAFACALLIRIVETKSSSQTNDASAIKKPTTFTSASNTPPRRTDCRVAARTLDEGSVNRVEQCGHASMVPASASV